MLLLIIIFFSYIFLFYDAVDTEICPALHTRSRPDAFPISGVGAELSPFLGLTVPPALAEQAGGSGAEPGKRGKKDGQGLYKWEDGKPVKPELPDRKSTRLNPNH